MAPTVDARAVFLYGLPAFVLAYVVAITLVSVANNGWYPIGTAEFCGSLGDFHDGAVPEVCLTFGEYWARAAFHPPYAALAILAGFAAAIGATRSRNRP